MSVECGECERDLRGGHWIGCSRYDLAEGLAVAMAKSIGFPVDDELPLDPRFVTMAKAAIEHFRAREVARAEGGRR